MKRLALCLAIVLSGCVVTPRGRVYVPPVVVGAVAGAAVASAIVYDEGVVYPEAPAAYIWDPVVGVWFFNDGYGHRRYMPRGWNYRTHGVPRGVYHRGH